MAQTLYPNLATDADARDRVERELLPSLPRVRNERRTLDQSWMRYYKIWAADRDQQAYHGRSRVYIPVGRQVIENWVQKLKRDLLAQGQDSLFDIKSLRQSFDERRNGLKTLFDYFLTKQMRIRRKLTPFLRQLVTYGTSPVALAWHYDERLLPVLRDIEDADGNLTGKVERALETVVQYVGPTFRVCDVFGWYVSPVTCADPWDANLLFEELLISKARLKEMGKQKIGDDDALGHIFENVQEALDLDANSAELSDKFQSEQQRLNLKGFNARVDAKDPSRPRDITEVYWRTSLDNGPSSWWRITIAGDRIPLRIQKNPFWHGYPPWLAGKFVEVVNEFYGRGLPEVFDKIQYFLNDIADQANDALVWSMNPIAIINPYGVQDPTSIRMRPGAKWLAEPDAIRFVEPPKESATVGFQATAQFMGLVSDVSNSTAFSGAGGQQARGRGRALSTATGAQLVATESLVQVRDVVENIEDAVFVPMLRRMHSLTMQCMTRPLILRVAGVDGASLIEHKISAADVVGDFDFEWLGSTQVQNQQVLASQLINYLQIASKIPPQLLAQNGVQIDFGQLLQQIWTYMGLRDSKRIIKPLKPMHSLDPRLENDLFVVGRGDEAQVVEGDNDDKHLMVHDEGLVNPKLEGWHRAQLMQHIQQHAVSKIAKEVMQQQQAMAQQQQQLMGGGNGAGRPPDQGMPVANPSRPNGTTGLDDLFRSLPRNIQ